MSTIKDGGGDDEEESEAENGGRSHLLVAGEEGGVSRVAATRLMEELFESTWRQRNRLRCTRDSWVQTEDAVNVVVAGDMQGLAPLASEEEFCSDSEVKHKPNLSIHDEPDRISVAVECAIRQSPECQIRQHAVIKELPESVLHSKVAIMPGSRDICGRSVLYVSLGRMKEYNVSPSQLAEILLYFQTIPKKDTMCLGFLAVIDGREVSTSESWSPLHKALALVEEHAPGTISLVLALHKSCHKADLLSSKYPIFHLKFEAIVNENQLLRYIAKDQLLPEFSGTYSYNQERWIDFHNLLDPFLQGCHQTGAQLAQLVEELRIEQLPDPIPSQMIEEQKQRMSDALQDPQLLYLETEGASFTKTLETFRPDFSNTSDFEEAVDKSKLLYKELQKVAQRLSRLADKRLNKLQESIKIKVFEEESSQVLTWLHRKGEETLKKHKTLAETLNAIREQESEFEKFYFAAMHQIERGNDLLEEIPRLRTTSSTLEEAGTGLSADLRRHLEDFTDRLEEAREKLEETSRCYYLLDKTYEWSLETMRFVSHMRVESTLSTLTSILKKLDLYLQAHPRIEDGVFEEMRQLANKLDNQALVQQCQTAKAKYQETLELVMARQQTLLTAKEQLSFEERPNVNENIDNLKIKPCLWNPLAPVTPYRTSSQTYLNGTGQGSQSLSSGSYTSFPSSYYPTSSFRERLLNLTQRKSHPDFFNKRGSVTDEFILERTALSQSKKRQLNLNVRPRSLADNDAMRGSESESSGSSQRKQSYPFSNEDYAVLRSKNVVSPDFCASESGSSNSSLTSQRKQSYPNEDQVRFRNGKSPEVCSSESGSSSSSQQKPSYLSENQIVLRSRNVKSPETCASDSRSSSSPQQHSQQYHSENPVLLRSRNTKNGESSVSDDRSVVSRMETASSISSKSYLEDDRNWGVYEAELKKFAEQVRDQNQVLEQQRWRTTPDGVISKHSRTLKMILMEMIQTERDYVRSLGYIIENYVPLLQNSNVRQALRSQRNILFGNIEKIYEFHNCYFLQELEQCESKPYSVGQCFLKYETQFYLYALYNKNKPKSDSLMAEYGNAFFKKKQLELGDKMDLASYLLKPVQRMGKYALLLKQLLKECPQTNTDQYYNLKAAEEMVRFQLRHGNDLLAMDALRECDVNIKEQGRLLRQEEFVVCQGKSKKTLRRVFLFEDLLLLSKARRDHHGNDYYQYKSSIKTSDMGLTAQVGESPAKFEIWFRKLKAHDLYVMQAPSADVKKAWVEEVSTLLWKQAERNRNLRLEEMSSMGIGNKPCLDITPSRDQICDRSISLQQLNKVPRFRNSIAITPSSDAFNNNDLSPSPPPSTGDAIPQRRRPLSIVSLSGSSQSSSGDRRPSSTFYDTPESLGEDEEAEKAKRMSMAQQSQCSAESGIFTDLSTSGDSYVENVHRMKTVERSDSVLSRTSYVSDEHKDTETSILISSSATGIEV